MREIQFRAWDNTRKQWIREDEFLVAPQYGGVIPWYNDGNTGFAQHNTVLMQYTGVNDMQGVPVFEGDIVEAELQNDFGSLELVTAKIVWVQEGLGCFTIDTVGDTGTGYGGMFKLNKVIGNIYENPELLTNDKT